MKISECDIDCYLIDWYGIDKNGYVFTAYSTGTSCVPEFVCLDYMNGLKEFDIIEEFFLNFEGFNLDNIRYIKELEEYIISKKDISNKLKEILNNKLNDNEGDIIFALKGITSFEILDGLDPHRRKEFAKHPYHYRKVIDDVKSGTSETAAPAFGNTYPLKWNTSKQAYYSGTITGLGKYVNCTSNNNDVTVTVKNSNAYVTASKEVSSAKITCTYSVSSGSEGTPFTIYNFAPSVDLCQVKRCQGFVYGGGSKVYSKSFNVKTSYYREIYHSSYA